MTDLPTGPSIRPLGAFEHLIDLYIGRNPVQFSLVVELAEPLTPARLEGALRRLQETHPLLAVGIDRTRGPSTFRSSTQPVPVRLVRARDWREVAAEEQACPFDASSSPLARAALVSLDPGSGATVLVLTFSHQITDGRGALRAVHDLLALLDGRVPAARPVPLDQESLLALLPGGEGRAAESPGAVPTSPPATIRPFDATPLHLEDAHLDPLSTRRLRSTARAHGATVQAALCAAAAQALFSHNGTETIRLNVPVDLRAALGLEDDVVNRFTGAAVVLRASGHSSAWSLARDAAAQLRRARSLARPTALALASLHPRDAAEAEAAMLAATAADLEITNLGVSEPGSTSATAVWGPVMTTQVRDERILGVVTHAGSLRMVLTAHGDGGGLAADIARRLGDLHD